MKEILDFKDRTVVNIYDEVNLWSALFGKVLLENIPMARRSKIVDIGFGTGFPLVELSQRFGETSKVYGIDIWKEGSRRAKEKIKKLELKNIELIENSASKIDIGNDEIDLVTSNLGINNFEEKEAVYFEVRRILKTGGTLSITTNPKGTFDELFAIFKSIFESMGLIEEQHKLEQYVEHRSTKKSIVEELEKFGFQLVKHKSEQASFRFVDADALLDHSLIRIGFRAYWENMIREEKRAAFFETLKKAVNDIIELKGEFSMTIPIVYLEFMKQ